MSNDQSNKKTNEDNKPLCVLHVLGSMGCGGAETRTMELLRRINRSSVQFDFCMPNRKPGYYEPEIKALGSNIIRCRFTKNLALFAWRFYRVLKQHKYDVVHCHLLTFSGICLTVARCAGVRKRVAHMRNSSSGKKDTLWRRIYRSLTINLLLRNATNIICLSKQISKVWFGPDYANNPKIAVIYNGLDTKPFHCGPEPDWLKREFDVPSSHQTVVHVGRFDPQKNHSKLVNIAKFFLDEHNETCFILVGDGSLRGEIEDSVKAKGLADKFRFAGIRSDVPRIMKNADALLFPSRWEGLPGTVLEAIAAGLPMVVSNLLEIREILDICGSAELLAVDAPDSEWSAALERAVNSPRQSQWLGELENSVFSFDSAWQNLLSVYQSD